MNQLNVGIGAAVPPLEQATGRLNDAIANLNDELHILYTRLNYYMTQAEKIPTPPPQTGVITTGSSAAVAKLTTIITTVQSMRDELRVLMDKLEA